MSAEPPRILIELGPDGGITFQSNVPPVVLLGMLEGAKAIILRDHFSATDRPRIAIPGFTMPLPRKGES